MIPGLFVISLISFLLVLNAPGDPLEVACQSEGVQRRTPRVERCLQETRKQLHLDRPAFYLALERWAIPDTLYRLLPAEQHAVRTMLARYGHWPSLAAFYARARQLGMYCHQQYSVSVDDPRQERWDSLYQWARYLCIETDPSTVDQFLRVMGQVAQEGRLEYVMQMTNVLETAWQTAQNRPAWRAYLPKIVWHGPDNQYHHWVSGILTRFDFGQSMQTRASVVGDWREAAGHSLRIMLIAITLSYLIAIPLGLWLARKGRGKRTQVMFLGFSVLEAIPTFGIATILLLLFANPDVLDWVKPRYEPLEASTYVLPIMTFVLGLMTTLTVITRNTARQVMQEDYIRTAKAKGLSERQLIRRHVLRHTLLPLMTTLSLQLPILLLGVPVIEEIFSIPGVSSKVLTIFRGKPDMPMLMLVFSLSTIMTMMGYLLADIVYPLIDPRIRHRDH